MINFIIISAGILNAFLMFLHPDEIIQQASSTRLQMIGLYFFLSAQIEGLKK